ncbi:MAG: CusA/CzcA family heavy metal efflux RND transporter [Verrucomicrobiota bacterium]
MNLKNWTRFCLRNQLVILLFFLGVTLWGIRALDRTPIDAIPDLSENQVIVLTEWNGRSAQEVEDQITFPLSSSLQGLAGVQNVRASSSFGYSMITVIFKDSVDVYFARARVLERLNALPFKLPESVVPSLGPDATGLGWVYEYYLDDSEARSKGKSLHLGEMRSLQDWTLRYAFAGVPGVAEVAGLGGYVRQYQIDVRPDSLRAYGLGLAQVSQAVVNGSRNVGGGVVESEGREWTLRGLALVEKPEDLEELLVGYFQGRPVQLKHVASVSMGPAERRGVLDRNGQEIVGGVIVMRYGENPLEVIQGVKNKIEEIQSVLPEGIRIRAFYDRSELIHRAIDTLKVTLIEAIILVTLAHIIFLRHLRSILVVTLPLPLSILIAFIFMDLFHVTSNIMSLSGIAIAIGVLVDAGIVITEAVLREARFVQEGKRPGLKYPEDLPEIIIRSIGLVGRPLFYSMAIILLAFVPVFALEGQEGKLFHPLAFTKTFAMMGSVFLALSLVPVLCRYLIRGHLHDENENPLMRGLLGIYLPALKWAMERRFIVLFCAAGLFIFSVSWATRLGKEFMPPLNEGMLLFMPTTLPGVSIPEIKRVMALQDQILAQIPEIDQAVGKLGRAESATDPAPPNMLETTIQLKPKSEWREGMTSQKIREEIIARMQDFPGFVPALLQPIENRVLMLSTGIRAQLGVKIFGPNLDTIQKTAFDVERILKTVPGAADVIAERFTGTPYLEFHLDREAAAQYGVPVGDVLETLETAIGGKVLATTIQGRQRIPIRVRYGRELRDTPAMLGKVLVMSQGGFSVPLEKIVQIKSVMGPSMISSENGQLRGFVQSNVRGRDLGGFVDEAKKRISTELTLPPGVYLGWSGQYENQIRAQKALVMIFPVVLGVILILLYFCYRSWTEASHVLLSVPFALSGGMIFQSLLGTPFSVAVWVGYIALFGTAIQTGMVMVLYLEESVTERFKLKGSALNPMELRQAILDGAALRLRPKVMTVATVLVSLAFVMIPFLSGDRTGIEVMRPIAIPVVGGMVSSLIHVLIVTPILFEWIRKRES